jgi:hypothetical protein
VAVSDALTPDLLTAVEAGDLEALVRFDASAMEFHHRAPREVVWRRESAIVRLTYQDDAVLGDEQTERGLLKSVHDSFAGHGAGLIEGAIIEPPLLDGERVLYLVAKVFRGEDGMVYMAMLRIPLVSGGFDVTVQSADRLMTGEREAAVLRRRAPRSRDIAALQGRATDFAWITDLFGGGGSDPWLPNQADDAGYDNGFPSHPLSVVRRVCADITASLTLSPICLDALRRQLPDPASGWV